MRDGFEGRTSVTGVAQITACATVELERPAVNEATLIARSGERDRLGRSRRALRDGGHLLYVRVKEPGAGLYVYEPK